MAKGDIIADVENIANNSSLVFQPAAGVEVIILAAGTLSAAADVDVRLFDTQTAIMSGGYVTHWAGKLGINNTAYLQMHNNNAAAQDIGFSGVQVK